MSRSGPRLDREATESGSREARLAKKSSPPVEDDDDVRAELLDDEVADPLEEAERVL